MPLTAVNPTVFNNTNTSFNMPTPAKEEVSLFDNNASKPSCLNLRHRLSVLTTLIREISFMESQLNKAEINLRQKMIQTETLEKSENIKKQAFIHAAEAVLFTVLSVVAIASPILKATELSAPKPIEALFQAEREASNNQAEREASNKLISFCNKALEETKKLITSLPSEQISNFFRTIEEGGKIPDNFIQSSNTIIDGETNKNESYKRQLQEAENLLRNAVEEMQNAYRSIANSEAESMRARG